MGRILVIEDKASMRAMVERLLESIHSVDTAPDGASGLRAIERESFDLVLTDVRLPDIDGQTILKQCKTTAPDTEVILMTAYASLDAAVQAVKAGAYDYLSKPFEPDDLLIKVDHALERRALKARAQAAEAALERRSKLNEMLGESPAIAWLQPMILEMKKTILPSKATIMQSSSTARRPSLLAI